LSYPVRNREEGGMKVYRLTVTLALYDDEYSSATHVMDAISENLHPCGTVGEHLGILDWKYVESPRLVEIPVSIDDYEEGDAFDVQS